MSQHKTAPLVAVAIALTALAIQQITANSFRVNTHPYVLTHDDVMITLRVARNFAQTGLPHFNIGERVAANTSLAWPIIISPLFHLLNEWQVVLAVRIISLICWLVVMWAGYFSLKSNISAIAFVVVLAILPSTRIYVSSGWENVPQMLLCTIAFLATMANRNNRIPAEFRTNVSLLLFSVAFLLRPDTAPLLLPFVLWTTWRLVNQRRVSDLITLILSATALLVYVVAHWQFYGTLTPNTASLKVDIGAASVLQGINYLFRSAVRSGNAVVVAAMLLSLTLKKTINNEEKLCLTSVALLLVYIMIVGGDVFAGGRFLLTITPFALWFTLRNMEDHQTPILYKLRDRWQQLVTPPIYAIICIVPVLSLMGLYILVPSLGALRDFGDEKRFAGTAEMQQIALTQKLTRIITPADGRIGLDRLGSVSYYFPDYLITDFLGKADPIIANLPPKHGPIGHNKWDYDYSLRNAQVSFIPYPGPPVWSVEYHYESAHEQRSFSYISELFFHPIIQDQYTYFPPEELVRQLQTGAFIRNDLVERVRDTMAAERAH